MNDLKIAFEIEILREKKTFVCPKNHQKTNRSHLSNLYFENVPQYLIICCKNQKNFFNENQHQNVKFENSIYAFFGMIVYKVNFLSEKN